MFIRSIGGAAAAIGLLLVSASHSQTVVPSARPDPLDAKAEVAPMMYTSTLGRYRPTGDVKVGSWREANDTVTRIGGWRAYAREANQPEMPAAAPAVQSAAPATTPPPGHLCRHEPK